LLSLEDDDEELAVHHFSRSLTIFEAAEDVYHTALAHYLIGKTIAEKSARPRPRKNICFPPRETFSQTRRRLASPETEKTLRKLKTVEPPKKRVQRAGSQLLMLRLAEATASRELLFPRTRRRFAAGKQSAKNHRRRNTTTKKDFSRLSRTATFRTKAWRLSPNFRKRSRKTIWKISPKRKI
jgi:hypothetical protein